MDPPISGQLDYGTWRHYKPFLLLKKMISLKLFKIVAGYLSSTLLGRKVFKWFKKSLQIL